MFSAIITSDGNINFTDSDGNSHTILKSYRYFKKALKQLRKISKAEDDDVEKEISKLVLYADPMNFINCVGKSISVESGIVYYHPDGGEKSVIHNTVTEKLINALRDGYDEKPIIRFLENVMQNPSYTAVNELYLFMEKGKMGITKDGHLLAYKKVNADYTDIHTGTFNNSDGQIVSMPRNEVDDDRDKLCSSGLHVCSKEYLPSFGGVGDDYRTVLCKINPRDVVSVPRDYHNTKMRSCKYEVVGESKEGREVDLEKKSIFEDDDVDYNTNYDTVLAKIIDIMVDYNDYNANEFDENSRFDEFDLTDLDKNYLSKVFKNEFDLNKKMNLNFHYDLKVLVEQIVAAKKATK